MRKAILIFLGLAAATGVVALGYYARRDGIPPVAQTDGSENLPDAPEATGSDSDNAAFYSPQGGSKILAYKPTVNGVLIVSVAGAVYRFENGDSARVGTSSLAGMISASISASGKTILASHGDPISPAWSYMPISSREWRRLPLEVRSAVWGPAGEAAILYESGARNGISRIDLSLKNPKPERVANIKLQDPILAWPAPNTVILGEAPGAHARSSLWSLDIKTKNFSLVAEDQIGLMAVWSPKGGAVFATRGSAGSGEFKFSDLEGNILSVFTFLTLPGKCGFSEDAGFFVCGVPQNRNFESQDLPDAYLKGAFPTADALWLVQTASGELSEVAAGGIGDAIDIQVKGNWIYFINRLDGKIYRVNIQQTTTNNQ